MNFKNKIGVIRRVWWFYVTRSSVILKTKDKIGLLICPVRYRRTDGEGTHWWATMG